MVRDKTKAFDVLERRIVAQYDMKPSTVEALYKLDHETRLLKADAYLHRDGDVEKRMYCLQKGWMIATYDGADGRRSIPRIYVPGDIIGWEDINWDYATTTVIASADSELTAFPKKQVSELFSLSRKASWVMHVITSIDYVWATDLNRVTARLDVTGKLAYLLLQLRSRQAFLTPDDTQRVYCPMNQSEIGDAIGVTNISVSRSLKPLHESGAIEIEKDAYRLLDIARLEALCDFTDRLSISPRQVSLPPKKRKLWPKAMLKA